MEWTLEKGSQKYYSCSRMFYPLYFLVGYGWNIDKLFRGICNLFLKFIIIYLFMLCQVLVAACGLLSCGMHAESSSPTRD